MEEERNENQVLRRVWSLDLWRWVLHPTIRAGGYNHNRNNSGCDHRLNNDDHRVCTEI